MSVENIPTKSKLILSKLVLSLMNKEIILTDELIRKAEIKLQKKKLREDYASSLEKFSASIINDKILHEERRVYNYRLTHLDLEYYQTESNIKKRELYYKRLEIIHNLLNNDPEITSIPYDEIYSSLIDAIKNEAISELEIKLKLSKLKLQMNVYTHELSSEDKDKYQTQVNETKQELEEVKKILTIDKINDIKEMAIDKIINNSSYSLLSNLYKDELYGLNTK